MLLKVRTRDTHALEALLAHLYAIPTMGDPSLCGAVDLSGATVQAETTETWPDMETRADRFRWEAVG